MDQKTRLIELLQSVPTDPEGNRNVAVIAKHLLANGVVVPVRCKDCKYYVSDVCRQDLAMNLCRDDDFCSYGEKGADNE